MFLIIKLIYMLLDLYGFVVLVNVVLSWLLVFNVINGHNQLVRSIYDFTRAMTEPVLRRIRRVIQPVNGYDLSSLVLLIAIWFAKQVIISYNTPSF